MKEIIDPRSAFERFETAGGVVVSRSTEEVGGRAAVETLIDRLDVRRGVLLSSNYDYPGRYTRWDVGFVDPPLALVASGRAVTVTALNARRSLLQATGNRVAAAVALVKALGGGWQAGG